MYRCRPLAALLLAALLPACLKTRVEVVTEVDAGGGATRTVTVVSRDDGAEADHPADLLPSGPGYALLSQGKGLRRTQGVFQDLSRMPAGYAFGAPGGSRAAGGTVGLRIQDWVLFKHYAYSERIQDVVEPDEVKAVLDEAAGVAASLLEATFQELLGPDFAETVLRKRLRTDLREMFREAAFIAWQEVSRSKDGAEADPEERILQRFAPLARRYGLDLEARMLIDWLRSGEHLDQAEGIRRALAAWLQEGLKPVKEGNRVTLVPDMEGLLFGGAFEEAFVRQAIARFGDEQKAENWASALWKRAFGVFGPDRSDIVFHLEVRMPGELLRSDGFLQGNGWTFLEFPAGDVYPEGRGIRCESVVWDPTVLGTLPGQMVLPENLAALQWMWVLGEGPGSAPDAELAGLVNQCARARSLGPLEEHLADPELEDPRRERARRLLEWLQGSRD